MKIGILGAGGIAGVLAATMVQMEDVTLYAVASRSLEKAEAFQKRFNIEKAYGSYEEMLNDKEVELVYVATPHSHHYEHMKLCIEHGKPVLCEKSFTFKAEEARAIKELSEKTGIYAAEAIWTRYMPSRKIINELLKEAPVGKVSMVTCNLSYDIDKVERIMRPELAGGALLDIGVYGLNFLIMHMGKDFNKIDSSVMMTETGVDGMESISLHYGEGRMGVTTHSIYGRSDRKGIFTCEHGYIIVENINNPNSIDVYDSDDKLIRHIDVPGQISGYEYEIRESMECIKAGRHESYSMPLSESVYMMELMESISNKWK